ncbi:cytochrome c oxidase subunit 3 [Methylibium sp.]|uniref:cytochrome c oxidase subunit 3 n=1 Tax=Methylibium sp. TaxID=2067992 RepID=UPI003D0D6E3C
MNPSGSAALLRAGPGDRRNDGGAVPAARHRRRQPGAAAGIGLWVFIGVASTLFALFLAAYVMRMDGADWSPIAMPWQLRLSTGLLLTGSLALQAAAAAARGARTAPARRLFLAGGAAALAFLASQLWAWQALQAIQVTLAGNPAASFFYLLTAMHGLHVAGGLAGWAWAARSASRGAPDEAWRLALCARYWHFLLAVWLLLFAALGWLTPAVVRYLCGTA